MFFSEEKAEARPAKPREFDVSASSKIDAIAEITPRAPEKTFFAAFLQT
jgi:hypothetical protein